MAQKDTSIALRRVNIKVVSWQAGSLEHISGAHSGARERAVAGWRARARNGQRRRNIKRDLFAVQVLVL